MKRLVKIIFIPALFMIPLFSACEDSITDPVSFEDDNIREIVLRDQFHNNGAGYYNDNGEIDTTIKVYFIANFSSMDSNYIGDYPYEEPGDELIDRFKNFERPVKKVTESSTLNFPTLHAYDKTTGELGIIFFTGPIRWLSSTEAEIAAGYEFAAGNAACYNYKLYKKYGVWWIYYKALIWAS